MRITSRISVARLLAAGMAAMAMSAVHAYTDVDYTNGNTLPCPNRNSTVGVWLDGLEAAILSANFLGRSAGSDQLNLLGKLATADAKTKQGKWDDARDKLIAIAEQADTLAGATKPKLESADAINAAASLAIACVTPP